MKFNVQNLIATVEQKIAEAKARDEAHNKAEQEKVGQHRAEWLEEYGDEYVAFANKIKEKIRKGRPILQSDVPEKLGGWNRRFNVFDVYRPKTREPGSPELESLLKALRAITDEEITPTALKSLGFNNLRALF